MEGGRGPVAEEGGKPNDAVIQIADPEEAPVTEEKSGSQSSTRKFEPSSLNTDGITGGSASPDKPEETPGQSLTRRNVVSRFWDPQHESDHDAKLVEGNDKELMHSPSTPTIVSLLDDDEEVYRKEKKNKEKKKKNKSNKIKKIFVVIVLIAFVCVMGLLISSLTVTKLKNHLLWGRELWKWCVLVSVIFCGRLVTKLLMISLICLIEKNFRLKLMVLYYVDGLRRNARAFVWFGLVLLSWSMLVERGVERSKETSKIINYITRGLVACLVGTVLWMIKTYSFKLLVASRLSKRFFGQIQEAIFDEYVICTCSGPPLMEIKAERTRSFRIMENKIGKQKKKKEKEEVIHVGEKRKKMKISAWTMEKLINHICSTKLSTLSNEICDEADDELERD